MSNEKKVSAVVENEQDLVVVDGSGGESRAVVLNGGSVGGGGDGASGGGGGGGVPEDIVAVKQSSSVSLIVSGGSGSKAQANSTSKLRSSSSVVSYNHSRSQQQHQRGVPGPMSYYHYMVPTASHQPLFYPTHPRATYLGGGGGGGGSGGGGGLGGGGGAGGGGGGGGSTMLGQLSNTNLYIRGLTEKCSDEDLTRMCQQYGKIVSTKAILDKETSCCKGYGFVDFENPADAMRAVQGLQSSGVMAQFAKQQEQDPTNLYFSNLPKDFDEKALEDLVSPHGEIISTRILRDQANLSRGVGFVRLDKKEQCDKTIEVLSGKTLPDTTEPLMVKFADSSSNKKRQHTAGRWRDVGSEYAVYEPTHMLAQNGLVGSRVMPQAGMLTSPYVQTPSHHLSGYQVPVTQTMSTGGWQPAYYVQPSTQAALSAATTVDGGVAASHLSSKFNQLHLPTAAATHHQASTQQPQSWAPTATGYFSQVPQQQDQVHEVGVDGHIHHPLLSLIG